MKFSQIFVLLLCATLSSVSYATLLNADEHYITFHHEDLNGGLGLDLDWVWASNYNVETYAFGEFTINTLFAPSVIEGGWRDATAEELDDFIAKVTIDLFLDGDGNPINAAALFNSDEYSVSTSDFTNGFVSGTHGAGITMQAFEPYDEGFYDTFYVRDTPQVAGSPSGQPIPEPWSLLVFSTALLALRFKIK